MKCQDTYKEVRTFIYPGAIVRVHIPELTEQERAVRQKRLHDAAARLLLAAERAKESKRIEQEGQRRETARALGADGGMAGGRPDDDRLYRSG